MFDSGLKAENEELKAKVAKLEAGMKRAWEVVDSQREERYQKMDPHEAAHLLGGKLSELAKSIEALLDGYYNLTNDAPEVDAYFKSGKYVVVVKLPVSGYGTRYMSRDNHHGWSL